MALSIASREYAGWKGTDKDTVAVIVEANVRLNPNRRLLTMTEAVEQTMQNVRNAKKLDIERILCRISPNSHYKRPLGLQVEDS